jgi:hypothetical protein
MSAKPLVPSFSDVGVSTRMIRAAGAMACAHWTSSDVSSAQLTIVELFPSNPGTGPAGRIISSFGARSPNWRSKTVRSCRIVGEPKLSTMTIVWPVPLIPARSKAPTE